MIDEDLYKIATDELNSGARKPEVWARACALASDDHDEARFLYTNLRVEEMLNKDGKQRTFSTSEQNRDRDIEVNGNNTAQTGVVEMDQAASFGADPLDSRDPIVGTTTLSSTNLSGSSVAQIDSGRASVDNKADKADKPISRVAVDR